MNGFDFAISVLSLCRNEAGEYDAGPLIGIANGIENEWLEFKAATKLQRSPSYAADATSHKRGPQRSDTDAAWKVAEACIAMANSIGGVILVGVSEIDESGGKAVPPVPVSLEASGFKGDWDKFARHLRDTVTKPTAGWRTALNGAWDYTRLPDCRIERCTYHGVMIAAILVPPQKREAGFFELEQTVNGIANPVIWRRAAGGAGARNEQVKGHSNISQWWNDRETDRLEFDAILDEFREQRFREQERARLGAEVDTAIQVYAALAASSIKEKQIKDPFTPLEAEEGVGAHDGYESLEPQLKPDFNPWEDEDLADDYPDNEPANGELNGEPDGPEPSTEGEEQVTPARLPVSGGVLEILSAHPRAVLLGEPGSGKTWCLQFLQLQWAGLRQPGGIFMLFVPLNRFTGDLWDLLSRSARGITVSQLQELASSGKLYLLLDGLNECPPAYVTVCKKQIGVLASSYPNVPIVLTSRAKHYDGFLASPVFTIKSLDEATQLAFLSRRMGGDEARAQSFLLDLKKSPGGSALVANPFLLKLAIEVSGDDSVVRSYLPAELHRMFIEKWYRREEQKYKKVGVLLSWSKHVFWKILTSLAFQSRLQGKLAGFQIDWAQSLVSSEFGEVLLPLLDWMVQGLAFSVENEGTYVRFRHESLQESLAAYHLASNPGDWEKISQGETKIEYWSNVIFHSLTLCPDFPDGRCAGGLSRELWDVVSAYEPWMLGRFDLTEDDILRYGTRKDGSPHPCLRAWLAGKSTPRVLPRGLQNEWSSGFAYLLQVDDWVRGRWNEFCEHLIVNLQPSNRPVLVLSKFVRTTAFAHGLSKPLPKKITDKIIDCIDIEAPGEASYISSLLRGGYLSLEDIQRLVHVIKERVLTGKPTIFQSGQWVASKLLAWEDFPHSLKQAWAKGADLDQAAFWAKFGSMGWNDFPQPVEEYLKSASPGMAARWVADGMFTWEDFSFRPKSWLESAQKQHGEPPPRSLRERWIAEAGLTAVLEMISAGKAAWHDFEERHGELIASSGPEHWDELVGLGCIPAGSATALKEARLVDANIDQCIQWLRKGLISINDVLSRKSDWIAHAPLQQALKLFSNGVIGAADIAYRLGSWADSASIDDAIHLIRSGLMNVAHFEHRFPEWISAATLNEAILLVNAGVIEAEVFASRKDDWLRDATTGQGIRAVSCGILCRADFGGTWDDWITRANTDDLINWINAGHLSWADVGGRHQGIIERVVPAQAARMVKLRVASPADFVGRISEWLPVTSPTRAVSLVEAGIGSWEDFRPCQPRWVAEVNIREAYELVSKGCLAWGDFKSRFSCWAEEPTPSLAAILVKNGVMGWGDFVRPGNVRPLSGALVKGVIVRFVTDGVEVELGGVSGTVQRKEMGASPKNDYKLGDLVDVVILGYYKGNKRLWLSMRLSKADRPLTYFLKEGEILNGVISEKREKDVFVEVKPGISGLLKAPRGVYADKKRGEKLMVIVSRIDPEEKRIYFRIADTNT